SSSAGRRRSLPDPSWNDDRKGAPASRAPFRLARAPVVAPAPGGHRRRRPGSRSAALGGRPLAPGLSSDRHQEPAGQRAEGGGLPGGDPRPRGDRDAAAGEPGGADEPVGAPVLAHERRQGGPP